MMFKKYLLLVYYSLIVSIVYSQTIKVEYLDASKNVIYNIKDYIYKREFKRTDTSFVLTEFWKNGNYKMIAHYLDSSFTVLNGEMMYYSESSKVLAINYYLKGKRNGEWKYWNDKGNLIETCLYLNDELVKKIKHDSIIQIDKESLPEFPGGQSALIDYLKNNLKYPEKARKQSIQGRVLVRFIVEKDGSINDAHILTSVDSLLDAEALRVVRSMPKWKPALKGDVPERVAFNLPITFRLEEKSPH